MIAIPRTGIKQKPGIFFVVAAVLLVWAGSFCSSPARDRLRFSRQTGS